MKSIHRPCERHVALTWLTLFAALVAACVSCQSKQAPATPTYVVTGKVYLDQKPLARALVVFHPLTGTTEAPVRSYAQTAADGSFRLSTFTPNDGAPVGSYRVTVHMQDEGDGPVRVPARYSEPAKTDLRADVKAEPTTLPTFHLRSN